jgi:hypothetical protein
VSSFTSDLRFAANRMAREAPKAANFQVLQNMGRLCDDLIDFDELGVRVRKVCPELNIKQQSSADHVVTPRLVKIACTL